MTNFHFCVFFMPFFPRIMIMLLSKLEKKILFSQLQSCYLAKEMFFSCVLNSKNSKKKKTNQKYSLHTAKIPTDLGKYFQGARITWTLFFEGAGIFVVVVLV